MQPPLHRLFLCVAHVLLPPSDEGGGFRRRRKTEGEKSSLPQSRHCRDSPLVRGGQGGVFLTSYFLLVEAVPYRATIPLVGFAGAGLPDRPQGNLRALKSQIFSSWKPSGHRVSREENPFFLAMSTASGKAQSMVSSAWVSAPRITLPPISCRAERTKSAG